MPAREEKPHPSPGYSAEDGLVRHCCDEYVYVFPGGRFIATSGGCARPSGTFAMASGFDVLCMDD
jgi:hypothetical protein